LKERRNAHGKIKPIKTLKNKKKERVSAIDERESRMGDEKVNKIISDQIREQNERMLKKDRGSK